MKKETKKELIGKTVFGGNVYLTNERCVNGYGYYFEAEVPNQMCPDVGESIELYSSWVIKLFKDPNEVLKAWGMKNNNLKGELKVNF